MHTRPQIAGSGFFSLMSATASWYFPRAVRPMYPWMSMPAGQESWQGPMQSA